MQELGDGSERTGRLVSCDSVHRTWDLKGLAVERAGAESLELVGPPDLKVTSQFLPSTVSSWVGYEADTLEINGRSTLRLKFLNGDELVLDPMETDLYPEELMWEVTSQTMPGWNLSGYCECFSFVDLVERELYERVITEHKRLLSKHSEASVAAYERARVQWVAYKRRMPRV